MSDAPPAQWPGIYVPNFSEWLPGDLIVVGASAGLSGKFLSAGQAASARSSSREGSSWTHAALYVGSDQVIEAIFPDGVVQSSLWKYCHERQVLVRRLKEPFTPEDGVDASNFAKTLVGNKYAWSEVLRSKLVPQTEPKPDALYCSTFVEFTINAATGFSLYGSAAHRPLHPSTIAEHPDLIDVNVEWRPHAAVPAVAPPTSSTVAP